MNRILKKHKSSHPTHFSQSHHIKVFRCFNVLFQQLERLGKEIEELKSENQALSENVQSLLPNFKQDQTKGFFLHYVKQFI